MRLAREPRRLGRPTKNEAASLGERLFDEAFAAFCTLGFAAASIEGIAAACGIGKNTIYRRFVDKQALFQAVIERKVHELDLHVARVAADAADPLEAVRLAARAVAIEMHQLQTRQMIRLFVSESVRFPGLAQLLDHWLETSYRQLDSLIVEAVRRKCLADRPVIELRQALLMLVATPSLDQLILPDRPMIMSDAQFGLRWGLFLTGCARQE